MCHELSGRTFVGYVYGGIRAILPNNTPSFPSDYVLKIYITPKTVSINNISSAVPDNFDLSQNYPNPFNPSTKIKFSIPENTFVNLSVYDDLGRELTNLVSSDLGAGSYEVDWDGSGFSSGVYYYKFETNLFSETKKMFLLK